MKGGSGGWGEFPAALIQQPAPRPRGQPLMGCTRLRRLVYSLPVLGHTCLCVPALKGPPGPGSDSGQSEARWSAAVAPWDCDPGLCEQGPRAGGDEGTAGTRQCLG